MKSNRQVLTALALLLSVSGCSGTGPGKSAAPSGSSQMTGAKILGFVQGTMKWSELSPEEQQLYTKIYNRQLPQEEQATWDKLLRPAARPGTEQTASKAQSIASSDTTSAKPSGPPQKPAAGGASAKRPTSNQELQEAAIHIRQAWQNQVSVETLSPFEKQTYSDIYKRKLPADRLKSWDSFLKQPSEAPTVIPVRLGGAITPTVMPAKLGGAITPTQSQTH